MPISDIAQITITSADAGVTQEGFGTPLILSESAPFAERTRTYTDLAGLVADGYAITKPEYLAAQALLSQEPRPAQFKMGKALLKGTQRYDITVATVANSTAYKVWVNGVAVTFTSDATATNDEIATGLAAAIDAAQATHTGTTTGAALSLKTRVTADAAGNWLSIEVDNPTMLSIAQTHADPGVATDLAAINLYDADWYALIIPGHASSAVVLAAAAWIETLDKLFLVASNDTEIISVASASATDVAEAVKDLAYARTSVWYHPDPSRFLDAAILGRNLPEDPGTENWFGRSLSGVDAIALTPTQRTNLRDKRANSYYNVTGSSAITFDGKTGANEWIDTVRVRDLLKARIGEAWLTRVLGANKIPYTDPGFAIVQADILQVLKAQVSTGALAADPAPTVTVPKAADMSPADRAARNLSGVTFSATLSGAINNIVVTGRLA